MEEGGLERVLQMSKEQRSDLDLINFKQQSALASLRGLLQREYAFEAVKYDLDKRIVNLISDMDFLICDTESRSDSHDEGEESSGHTTFHKLLKKTDKHLIVITYEVRKRLVCPPNPLDDPSMIDRLSDDTFGNFLRKYNMVPPN